MKPPSDPSTGQRERPSWSDCVIARMFGKHYATARLTNWQYHGTAEHVSRQRTVLAAVEELCHGMDELIHGGRNVLIYGQCGTGKDRLMVSLCRAAIAQYAAEEAIAQVVRWRGSDLWMEVRDGIRVDQRESVLLYELCRPKVLVLSDPIVPSQSGTEFQQDWIYRILEHRQALGRGVWMTTNASDKEELALMLGPANASRIRDRAIAISCDWSEYRHVEVRV